MAEGDGHIYQVFKAEIMKGTVDLVNDTIKCALVAGYTRDEDGHTVWAGTAVSGKEITDASYSAQTLTGQSVTATGTGSGTAVMGKFDAADVRFSSLTGTDPNYLILYDDTVTAPADMLVGCWELTQLTTGADYIIQWDASGIIRIK